MPHGLTNAVIKELTLVFKTDPETGKEFSPRNPMARILSVKGGESKTFVTRVVESLKGYFTTPDDKDSTDGDDISAIASAIMQCYMDISSCCGIMDETARGIAMEAAINSFLDQLDEFRSVDKAGARHSKMDADRIQKMGDAIEKAKKSNAQVGKHIETASQAHAELMPAGPESQADKEEANADKGDGEGEDDATKAAPEDKPCADVEYRVGIDVSDKAAEVLDVLKAVSEHGPVLAGPVEVERPNDDIAEKLGSMLEAFATTFKADIAKRLDDHTAAVDGKIDTILSPVTDELKTKSDEVSRLTASINAMDVKKARENTSPGGLARYTGGAYQTASGLIEAETEQVNVTPNTPVSEAFKTILAAQRSA